MLGNCTASEHGEAFPVSLVACVCVRPGFVGLQRASGATKAPRGRWPRGGVTVGHNQTPCLSTALCSRPPGDHSTEHKVGARVGRRWVRKSQVGRPWVPSPHSPQATAVGSARVASFAAVSDLLTAFPENPADLGSPASCLEGTQRCDCVLRLTPVGVLSGAHAAGPARPMGGEYRVRGFH